MATTTVTSAGVDAGDATACGECGRGGGGGGGGGGRGDEDAATRNRRGVELGTVSSARADEDDAARGVRPGRRKDAGVRARRGTLGATRCGGAASVASCVAVVAVIARNRARVTRTAGVGTAK